MLDAYTLVVPMTTQHITDPQIVDMPCCLYNPTMGVQHLALRQPIHIGIWMASLHVTLQGAELSGTLYTAYKYLTFPGWEMLLWSKSMLVVNLLLAGSVGQYTTTRAATCNMSEDPHSILPFNCFQWLKKIHKKISCFYNNEYWCTCNSAGYYRDKRWLLKKKKSAEFSAY